MSSPLRPILPAGAGGLSRRGLLRLGGAAAAGLGLSACGLAGPGGGGGGGGGASAAPTAPLAVEGTPGGSIRILDDNTNQVFTAGLIDEFTRQTGVQVQYEQGNFNDLQDRLATLFSASDASYDVVFTWAAWTAQFGQAGWLQPLDRGVVPPGLLQAGLDSVSWNGTVYGLPKFASVQTMYWNKAHFREAGLDPDKTPATWDEFVAAAVAATRDGRFGFAADMGNVDGAYQVFLKTLLLNGGAMYDAQNKPTFAEEPGVDALTRLKGLLDEKIMSPSSLQITNSSDLNTVFANGAASIVFNWPAQWAAAVTKGPLKAEDVGLGVLPGIRVPTASIDGSCGYAINVRSANKQGALAWLRFVTGREVQTRIVTEEGWLPVSQELITDPAIVKAQPVVPIYAEANKGPIRRYGSPWYTDSVQVLSAGITKAMLGQVSPTEALTTASQQVTDIVARYNR